MTPVYAESTGLLACTECNGVGEVQVGWDAPCNAPRTGPCPACQGECEVDAAALDVYAEWVTPNLALSSLITAARDADVYVRGGS